MTGVRCAVMFKVWLFEYGSGRGGLSGGGRSIGVYQVNYANKKINEIHTINKVQNANAKPRKQIRNVRDINAALKHRSPIGRGPERDFACHRLGVCKAWGKCVGFGLLGEGRSRVSSHPSCRYFGLMITCVTRMRTSRNIPIYILETILNLNV